MGLKPDARWAAHARGVGDSARRIMITVVTTLGVIYGAVCIAAYLFQERLVYFPWRQLDRTPAEVGLAFEERWLETEDGVRLHAWWMPRDDDAPAALFLHGNAGNISNRVGIARMLHDLGLSVLLVDYRGYGLSGGTPSELGTYRDAQAAYDMLLAELGGDASRMIIMGRSLGSGVATWLAARNDHAALILESAFTSILAMARHHYPLLPLRLLVRLHYDNAARIAALERPLLVVHARDDEIVPFSQGEALYRRAREPKTLLVLEGSHNDAFYRSHREYRQGLAEFVAGVVAGQRRAGRDQTQ